MCGINWWITTGQSSLQVLQEGIDTMNLAIKHRGPDSVWTHLTTNADHTIALGQVRLSIIDLSAWGYQPMLYAKDHGGFSQHFHTPLYQKYVDALSIVFNWEIYNYQEIKQELVTRWYTFNSHSDTEVILAAYQEYGEACVDMFNGMWALVIYDPANKILLCSRDKLWQKPFYYYCDGNQFIFSSEIKGILSHTELALNTKENINPEALEYYFTTWYIPAPLTIYKNIEKLEARHSMIVHLEADWFTLEDSEYCPLPAYKPLYDKRTLLQQWKELMDDAIKLRMFTADVPVGAFLSWGVDSSSTVAMMTQHTAVERLHTFSVWFEWAYDESFYITLAKDAFGTAHHHVYYTEDDFVAMIDTIHDQYDEPFSDYSHFPTLFISAKAKEHLTVCLSGDGWDEVFGWYTMHSIGWLMQQLYRLPYRIRKTIAWVIPSWWSEIWMICVAKELWRVSCHPPEEFHAHFLEWVKYIGTDYKQRTINAMQTLLEVNSWNFVQSMIDFDCFYNTLSDNFLVKVDRASMTHGLEVRSPFLDRRLVEYAHTIPTKRKVTLTKRKKILKEIMKDLLPQQIISRKKAWFEPPIDKRLTQKKYQDYTLAWVERLAQQWVLPDQVVSFYRKQVLAKKHKLANIYTIRFFLFIWWYDRWIQDPLAQ